MQENAQHQEKYVRPLIQEPKGIVAKFFWRIWIFISTTFAFSMMEPWEHILVFAVVGIMLSLFSVGIYSYVPRYAGVAFSQARYYLYGIESAGREYVVDKLRKLEL